MTDNLFDDLGGHSLKAARLVSAMRKFAEFEGLSLEDVYEAPTVRTLALHIGMAGSGARSAMPEFHHMAVWKRYLCAAAQTIALPPIYTVAGLQWFFPYLAYKWLATVMDRVPAL